MVKGWVIPAQFGDAVISPDGRVGMVSLIAKNGIRIEVQYGPDGPFCAWDIRILRWATREEVVAAGLDGVGGLNVRV